MTVRVHPGRVLELSSEAGRLALVRQADGAVLVSVSGPGEGSVPAAVLVAAAEVRYVGQFLAGA